MHVYEESDIGYNETRTGYNEQIRLDLGARFIRFLLYFEPTSLGKLTIFEPRFGIRSQKKSFCSKLVP